MLWQDIVISISQLILFIGLIPSIKSAQKPALSTSVISASAVTVITITLGTLYLWLSVVTASLIAGGWWILAWQSWTIEKKR